MATQLQRQLAVIAANSTHQLDLKAQKAAHAKSLLFDRTVAVSQDFFTLYQICSEGFTELCALDGRFAQYSESLFSEQSMSEEREQWTQEQNAAIDAEIEGFLSLAQPRLLLKPAQKAVEWLVRRFRIHEYNTDNVILAFLPYHSTPLFQSLLEILPKKGSQIFRFLYPYMTTLDNPPFQTIVNAAAQSQGLVTAFNQYLLAAGRAGNISSLLVSFWSSVTTQAVDCMLEAAQSGREAVQKQRTDDVLLRVLPVLNEALSFKDFPELAVGCCMVISVLATRGNLEERVLDGLMEAVSNSWSESSIEERLACMALLSLERQQVRLSRPVTKRLLLVDNITHRLLALQPQCRVGRLAAGLTLGCIARVAKHTSSKEIKAIDSLLRSGLLGPHHMSMAIRSLLTACVELNGSPKLDPEDRATLAACVRHLAQTPPMSFAFEKAIKKAALNRDAIEIALQTVIPRTQDDELKSILPQSTGVATQSTKPDGFQNLIEGISQLELVKNSFFSLEMSGSFESLAKVFLQTLNSESNLRTFCDLSSLRKSSAAGHPAFLTFFTRALVSTVPSSAKCVALRVISITIASSSNRGYDFQGVLPYLICALADPLASVRRAAADTLKTINAEYKASLQSSEVLKPWAGGHIYPETPEFGSPLSSSDASDFIRKVLLPDIEACVLDSATIGTVLHVALDGTSEWKTSGLKVTSVELKSSRRASVYGFLASHFAATPLLHVQSNLAPILSRVGKTGSSIRSKTLLPLVNSWVNLSNEEVMERCLQQNISLKTLAANLLKLCTPREQDGIHILQKIVTGGLARRRDDITDAAFTRLREIWKAVPKTHKEIIAEELAKMVSESGPMRDQALESLKTLKMPTEVLMHLLTTLPKAVNMPDKPPLAKRRRTSRNDVANFEVKDTEESAQALRKYTLVLELVENSTPASHPQLLKPLFHCLAELQHFAAQANSGLIYLKGLTINSLLAIVDSLKDTQIDPEDKTAIRTDLLVDCVRNTTNPQVQNATLCLISCLAVWVPEVVLHSVMPIFTFMGSSILRQSDDYSAHVIDQTVSRVVPPLIASLKRRSRHVISGASDLLLGFTAAFEHMPQHRRLGLFENLTRTLGPEDCLFAVVVMIIDRYPTDARARRFVADLMNLFDPEVELLAITQYIRLVADSLKPRRELSESLLSLREKTPDQVQTVTLNLLNALTILLHDVTLRSRVSDSLHGNNSSAQAQRKCFSQLLQQSIELTMTLRANEELGPAASRVLTNIFKLLPAADLISTTDTLLEQQPDEIRLVVSKSIDAQIRDLKNPDRDTKQALLDFIPRLKNLISASENIPLLHTAIALVDQISERFGKQDTVPIVLAAPVVIQRGLGHSNERVRVISLLCLTSMVDVLQDDFVPLFPNICSRAFGYLKSTLEEQKASISLFNGAFAFIIACIENLSYIIGDNLLEALLLALRCAETEMAVQTEETRRQFYQLVVEKMPAAEVYLALDRAFIPAQNNGFDAIAEYLKVLKAAVEEHTKSMIVKNGNVLFDILHKGLDLRRSVIAGQVDYAYDNEEVEQIENLLIEITVTITLKLNDATFRPFFAGLVDWSKEVSSPDLTYQTSRTITVFKLFRALFDRLKSLLTSYSSYCLPLVEEVLKDVSPTDDDADRLLEAVLGALEKSFEHDEDDFWQSPAHFEPICEPLLSRLSFCSPTLLKDTLIPAVTALAAAVSGSADHHKAMNSRILKLMRDDAASTRLAAVKTEQALTARLGEDWLALLPEMLPFITELLEDDDETVEKETRRWIRSVEEILGESLEGMLQ